MRPSCIRGRQVRWTPTWPIKLVLRVSWLNHRPTPSPCKGKKRPSAELRFLSSIIIFHLWIGTFQHARSHKSAFFCIRRLTFKHQRVGKVSRILLEQWARATVLSRKRLIVRSNFSRQNPLFFSALKAQTFFTPKLHKLVYCRERLPVSSYRCRHSSLIELRSPAQHTCSI